MSSLSAPKKTANQALVTTSSTKKALVSCETKNNKSSPNGAKAPTSKHPKHGKTKITVQYDCGFSNNLFIRGEGIEGLSWDKGALMHCDKNNQWSWETDKHFKNAKIKILINDQQYESGENHIISCDKSLCITPQF